MKLFPNSFYEFKFLTTEEAAWNNLRQNTHESSSLVSSKTDKKFIGIIRSGYFKLISSVPGKGAFCTIEGNSDSLNAVGTIQIEVHKAFKILILIWIILVCGGALFLFFTKGLLISMKVFLLLGVFIFLIRFLAFELLFKSVCKDTLDKLIQIMGIELK